MRTGASDVPPRGLRSRLRLDARLQKARKAHLRHGVLEFLEPRTLMAVLPAPQVAGDVAGISTTGGNVSSPLVVVDRYDPNHLASIWVRNDPSLAPGNVTLVQGAFSSDGGLSWTNFATLGTSIATPLQVDAGIAPGPNGFTFYTQTNNPQIAFDNAHNLYVLTQQSNGANTSGALLLRKFNFSGSSPSLVSDQVVRQYVTDAVFNPTLTVDDNQAQFVDPTNGFVQTDPTAGNVWIGWSTNEAAPTGDLFLRPGSTWNPNSIQVIVSSDGGATFSGASKVNVTGGESSFNAWGRWTGPNSLFANATPKIVVGQGKAADPTIPGAVGANAGGGAAVVWDNFGRFGTDFGDTTSDAIQANQLSSGFAYAFNGATGDINQAITTASGPYTTQNSSFGINVQVDPARFNSLSKLTLNMTVQQTDMTWLQAVLTGPATAIDPATGQPIKILIFSNAQDAAGVTPTGQVRGVTGANLGIVGMTGNPAFPYGLIGGTFDDDAARSINDRSGAAAGYTSTYRTESIDLGLPFGADPALRSLEYLNSLGLTAGQINGAWTLTFTAFRNNGTNPGPRLLDLGLSVTSGADVNGQSEQVATTLVRGSQSGAYTRASAAAGPQGIGPAVDAAIDNTLGDFSPFQGRIYVTFVGYRDIRTNGVINPLDNTDIFLATSDDGGVTWVNQGLVNDDQGSVDGFSGANQLTSQGQIVGRAQFLPQAAVDQTTGTLVLSWRDGRDDSARARSAVYATASIDGGGSFSAQSYATPTQSSTDAITELEVILNPAGDNFNNVDPAASAFGFGSQMGLTVGSGQVYFAWAGNQNESHLDSTQAIRGDTFQAFVQRMTIAAGPRVIGSTQGVVGLPGDAVNTLRAADGSPVANAFVLTFDRPIDPDQVRNAGDATFTTDDVFVFFRGTAVGVAATRLPVLSVVPVQGSRVGRFGYTQFTVTFDPWNGGSPGDFTNLVGTYSYLLGPAITDQVRVVTSGGTRRGNAMDENANGVAGEDPIGSGYTGTTPGDAYATPTPSLRFQTWGPTAREILQPPFDTTTLPLIVPGAHVIATSAPGSTGSDNLLLDGTTSSLNVRFDRDIQVGSVTAADVLQIMGPTGSLMGPQYFASDKVGQAIPAPTSATTPGILSSSLTVPSYDGTFTAADVTLTLNLTFALDSNLTLDLTSPAGTKLNLFTGAGGNAAGANFVNTTFSDAAATTIGAGVAPYTGTFRPAGAGGMAVFDGQSIQGQWTLTVTNVRTGAVGVLNDWSLNVTPVISVRAVNPSGLYAREFAVDFPKQSLSGTYTVQLASAILDRYNQAIDTNLNAGLDVLRGEAANVPTTSVTFNSGTVNQPLINNRITSTINVTDSFPIQAVSATSGITGLRLRLSLATANVAPLTATLTNGTKTVTLFANLVQGPNGGGFVDAIFDDAAPTPISQSSPPYSGASFNPLRSLLNPTNGFLDAPSGGTWQLTITSTGGAAATLNSWSLLFEKPLPTSGLGEPVADRTGGSFRIFQTDASNALSRNTWTSVGPAPVSGSSGRIGAMAQDTSDPTGNTFFIGGASGGVWKTTNFLTTDPQGPTYIPLTDFGPSNGLNIGGIAVFARNNDPNQSIVIASTGEGDSGSQGVGFLISKDGGATWRLYDSSTNVDAAGAPLPIASTARDRIFVGTTTFKVVVDPKATLQNQVIIYAAVSGTNGGLWRSLDTGDHWQLMKAGNATDVVLDPTSDTGGGTDPNLQVLYAAFRGDGVYISPNRGQVWNILAGGVGNPLVVDTFDRRSVAVANPGVNPNGAHGRIALVKPDLTGVPLADQLYAGWLYAAVANTDGSLFGLFMTKDFGANWVQVRIPTEPPLGNFTPSIPSNDVTLNDYTVTNGDGNFALSLAVDPTNPNVVYLGGFHAPATGTGMIRVDATKIWDAYNLTLFSSVSKDGLTDWSSTGPVTIGNILDGFATQGDFLNYIRDPGNPFNADATRFVRNLVQFTNNGFGTEWIPFDAPISGGGTAPDYHRLITMIDPTSGLTRLVYGTNRGVWSVLDDDGKQLIGTSVGTTPTPGGDRNGNLQITQFYYGAVQPNNVGAAVSRDQALFYGSSNDQGQFSDGNILNNGDLLWFPTFEGTSSGGVAVDPQGFGTVYQAFAPGSMSVNQGTTFYRVNHIGRTFGLIQSSSGSSDVPDPQWGPGPGATFAVNSLSGQQIMISSSTGRIFSTTNQGGTWFEIGAPTVFGSPTGYSQALAYGAPDPAAPGGIGNLGNFMYVGTNTGRVFLTRTGGGGTQNSWQEASTGLDGSSVLRIIPSPVRGSHAAYAVTSTGVFFIRDSVAAGASWVNVTGNLRNLSYTIFGQNYNQNTDPNGIKLSQSLSLSAMVVDWRYSIPNATADPVGAGLHPVLYVSGDTGVFRSLDNGVTWSLYPNQDVDGAPILGGYLPRTEATDLDLSLGAINPATGVPNLLGPLDPYSATAQGDPDLLLASTWGRGMFSIKMAPLTIPGTVRVAAADTNGTAPDGTPIVTTSQFRVSGLSMTSGFNNATRITIYDQTDGKIIGGFDIARPGTDPTTNPPGTNVPANWTDSFGNFTIQVGAGLLPSNGLKVLKIYATDDAGAVGNPITLSITVDADDLGNSTVPADPSLALRASDNTGLVPAQNYTNHPNPGFVGTTTAGAAVELYLLGAGGTFAPFSPPVTTIADASGGFTLLLPTLGDGTYTVVAVASNAAGLAAHPSPQVTVRVKTQGPTAAPSLTLNPNYDSGIVGDNITNVRKPVFNGTVGATNAGSIIRIYQAPLTNPAGPILAQTTADASGNFAVQLPLALNNGLIGLTATAVDPAGNVAPGSSPTLAMTIVTTGLDYSGSALDLGGSSSLSQSQSMLYLRNDGVGFGQWFTHYTPPSFVPIWFPNGASVGSAGDIPLAGDFDADGKNDLAAFRSADASWVVWRSTQGGLTFKFGTGGSSVPIVGNFDGPGATQYGVYDLVNGTTGVWTLTTPSGSIRSFGFGVAGDVPLVGDFLGLGYDQPTVYRPSTGQFLTYSLAGGTFDVVATLPANQIPVPGKYDNLYFHDNGLAYKTIPAVFDPTLGVFTIARPAGSQFPTQVVFQGGDIPVPADYAGVGWDLPAVYRPTTGQFLVKMVQTLPNGADAEVTSFPGAVGAPVVPVGAPLAYRTLTTSSLIAGALPSAQTRGFASASATAGPARSDVAGSTTTTTTSTTTTTGAATTAPAATVARAATSAATPVNQETVSTLPSLSLSGSNASGARQPWFDGAAAPGTKVDLYLGGTGVMGSKKVGTAVADAAGRYAFQLPAGARNGSYTLTARAAGADGSSTPIAAATFQLAPAAKVRTPVRGRFARATGAAIRAKATPAAASAGPQAVAQTVVAVNPAAVTAAPLTSDAFSRAIQSLDESRLGTSRKRPV
ncbi:Ig-like domain-containing protein [Paludisphaera mucosa]|uniref:Ig-like domain-containing protein n=1 Tax=Paludisphaera mucosa TaxID=3030827 RepID=A0ABT6FL69_9BACT|nr:Ig-like domain-containing protein [Paludisphaera mucosa]MDG3008110.1 Ig-like domain-containing protein [Paludisphaera mucosa]